MRWVLITFESLVTGVVAVVAFLMAFFAGLSTYFRYVLGFTGQVGWDPASLFGYHWKAIIVSILAAIFLLGAGIGFWFFRPASTSLGTHGQNR